MTDDVDNLKQNKEVHKEVHLVIYRQSLQYGYGYYDSVQYVTLDYDLAKKEIKDNEHDYPGILFIETHQLMENKND